MSNTTAPKTVTFDGERYRTASLSAKVSRGGHVTTREGAGIGWVRKIDWPESHGGRVIATQVWEAVPDHEILTVGKAFPAFATRREAVAHLERMHFHG